MSRQATPAPRGIESPIGSRTADLAQGSRKAETTTMGTATLHCHGATVNAQRVTACRYESVAADLILEELTMARIRQFVLFCIALSLALGMGVGCDSTRPGPTCTVDADCSDGAFCNGAESCVDGRCQPGEAPCGADEVCDEAADACGVGDPVAVSRAHTFLENVMDQYHAEWLDVYTDVASAGNHFVHSAAMFGGVDSTELFDDDACEDQPHQGGTCIKYGFLGRGNDWGGFYRMNGVLRGENASPEPNWGTEPEAGLDLTGADELVFWARGANGGEQVEFFAFGVGWDSDAGNPVEAHPDSSPKLSTQYITLSKDWGQYSVVLAGVDLEYALGGFGWVTNAPRNSDRDVVFYVDDIRHRLSRPTELRLLQSYATRSSDQDAESLFRNLATTYDNALALIAFLACGDMQRAQLLADAFVHAQNHDRYFEDGRLRNGYQAGDLAVWPGWEPHGRKDTARIPGWWGSEQEGAPPRWYEDKGFVGSKVGDLAWPIIALLAYRDATGAYGDDEYVQTAVALGNWIEENCRSTIGDGGYTGGYEGWEPDQEHVTWKSTEHNIDVYVAFSRLHQTTGDRVWQERASAARRFVDSTWNSDGGHFWTGTTDDGVTPNRDVIPLDIQAWAVLALEGEPGYERALTWAEDNCEVEHGGYCGFDFDTDGDGVWFEGTAHMVLAYRTIGKEDRAQWYLSHLENAQAHDAMGDGFGLVAASTDGLTTGFGTTYARRLHVGATCWLIFAEMNYNPYWR